MIEETITRLWVDGTIAALALGAVAILFVGVLLWLDAKERLQ